MVLSGILGNGEAENSASVDKFKEMNWNGILGYGLERHTQV